MLRNELTTDRKCNYVIYVLKKLQQIPKITLCEYKFQIENEKQNFIENKYR